LVQHLPGVGRNFQDHIIAGCHWEHKSALYLRATMGLRRLPSGKAMLRSTRPICNRLWSPLVAPATADDAVAAASWGLCSTAVRPLSRGQLRITGPKPCDRSRSRQAPSVILQRSKR
jgi:choline dehydrogenase